MTDYYEKLLMEIRKPKPDPRVMEFLEANITKRFCPHMFFHDIDKDQENVHCKWGTPADCYKCWYGKSEPKPKVKKERKKKNESNTTTKSNTTTTKKTGKNNNIKGNSTRPKKSRKAKKAK